MAFLSTGEDPNFGRYAKNVRAALRYIIRNQKTRTGYIPNSMYEHGFAMLALSEAYGAVDEEMLWTGEEKNGSRRSIGKALELAVRLSVTSQKKNPSKGWRYSPNDGSADTSVVGAVLMGLLAARNAGIDVPDKTIDDALKYMKSMTSAETGDVGYSGLGGLGESGARSAIACLVFSIGKRKKWKEWEGVRKYLADHFGHRIQPKLALLRALLQSPGALSSRLRIVAKMESRYDSGTPRNANREWTDRK